MIKSRLPKMVYLPQNMLSMSTVEVFFPGVSDEESEMITALLSQLSYESFWNEERGLRAYINAENFKRGALEDVLHLLGLKVHFEVQNASPGEWGISSEDTFDSVFIGEKIWLGKPGEHYQGGADYVLRVDPQLAFGSGAHPSTLLCIEMMIGLDFKMKSVVDAGTGTAVLAALASMMGAGEIVAFDNNPWALDVAQNTLKINSVKNVELIHCGVEEMDGTFDIVLANLNYSVFEQSFDSVACLVAPNGLLLLSGVMLKDEANILNMAHRSGCEVVSRLDKDGWCALLLKTV
jgi:ribosomal protein L11 methyltransferase